MGITNLLQLLKPVAQKIHISQFKGQTVAIDTYCWIHRACYSCAIELTQNINIDSYVQFCLKRIELLLHFGIKPLLVFDGRHLPAKEAKEQYRANNRQNNLERAKKMKLLGNQEEAERFYRLSVDYVVAPYEADAQLAYLVLNNYASAVITEDSDLLVFGAQRVFLKMDHTGEGQALDITQVQNMRDELIDFTGWTHDMFAMMCILAGCDYLDSPKGMGIRTAHKVVKQGKTEEQILYSLRNNSKLPPSIAPSLPKDYEQQFHQALLTFKHQTVYSPKEQRLVPIMSYPLGTSDKDFNFCGPHFDNQIARRIAIGELDPFTFKPFISDKGGSNIIEIHGCLGNGIQDMKKKQKDNLKINLNQDLTETKTSISKNDADLLIGLQKQPSNFASYLFPNPEQQVSLNIDNNQFPQLLTSSKSKLYRIAPSTDNYQNMKVSNLNRPSSLISFEPISPIVEQSFSKQYDLIDATTSLIRF
ncbi:MAG: putative Exonuclease 1 [Streblomastix strix]|uniref:Putative Exonuclease 1 n=1 Tax=Streblomastix strix TaxID=222440 RepID=A0A5J4XA10_9EUKA|nr:MAG: putative Exonuclease 1 [Streblomastix strix]